MSFVSVSFGTNLAHPAPELVVKSLVCIHPQPASRWWPDIAGKPPLLWLGSIFILRPVYVLNLDGGVKNWQPWSLQRWWCWEKNPIIPIWEDKSERCWCRYGSVWLAPVWVRQTNLRWINLNMTLRIIHILSLTVKTRVCLQTHTLYTRVLLHTRNAQIFALLCKGGSQAPTAEEQVDLGRWRLDEATARVMQESSHHKQPAFSFHVPASSLLCPYWTQIYSLVSAKVFNRCWSSWLNNYHIMSGQKGSKEPGKWGGLGESSHPSLGIPAAPLLMSGCFTWRGWLSCWCCFSSFR